MSEENVEIVRRALDFFSRSDRASIELHPDVEWRTVLGPLLGVDALIWVKGEFSS